MCFQNDMAYGDFRDLPRRQACYKVLCDKLFNVAKNSKYDGYQKDLLLIIYKCFWHVHMARELNYSR